MRTLGLVMKMGKITAVQPNSPAAQADIRAGDAITAVDDQPIEDPMRLPDVLRRRARQTVKLSISREAHAGQDEKLDKDVVLRDWPWWEDSPDLGMSVSVPSLGITYKVLNIVHQTIKDSPAAQAEVLDGDKPASVPRLAAGDEIVGAELILPEPQEGEAGNERRPTEKERRLPFSADQPNWPFFMYQLQYLPPDTRIRLTLNNGRTATLAIAEAEDWFLPDRGLNPSLEMVTVKADSFSDAVKLAALETRDAVLQVYIFLRKIGSQISVFSLGGPKSIVEAAGGAANESFSKLLLFLTLLSANLAVVNFLPIPLLDGGHMVFLVLEGILRRPVSDKVIIAFHYLGFVFIISLMLFVLGLDFGLIPRQ
jgi:regulator of sigma E protease